MHDVMEIARAARLLEAGELVAFPTETVYGLGANAENPAAVARIYAAKGRPSNHPVIVHLHRNADIGYWVAQLPDAGRRLIEAFWPGPLTLILKRAQHIPDAVSGGQDTVGIRCPSHPVAQALLAEFRQGQGGVAAPSANKFGHVSPTLAEHVIEEFGNTLPCVLDGGQSEVGIESTIIDLSRAHPALLRPGGISVARVAEVLGFEPAAPDAQAPRVSGALASHYAPMTPLAAVTVDRFDEVINRLLANGRRVAIMSRTCASPVDACAQRMMPQDADQYAHDLYAALRDLDHAHADIIIVEALPQAAAWLGVNDRLRRAAHDSQGVLENFL